MKPLTPLDCDLRNFPHMPLDVVRLRDSDLAALEGAEEFRAAVLLWCASWHQIPAASLPDDDRVLANLAGFGRVVKEWNKVRDGALRGWIKCSDGRLYHPVIAEKALSALDSKYKQEWRTEIARIRKHNQRHRDSQLSEPDFETWLSYRTNKQCLTGQGLNVSSQSHGKEHPTEQNRTEQITQLNNSSEDNNLPSVPTVQLTLKAEICIALTELNLPPFNAMNPKFMKLVEAEGTTVEEFTATAIEIRQRDPSKFNFDYLISVIAGRRKDAEAMPSTPAAKPKEDLSWRTDDNQIVAKANQMGIGTYGKNRIELLAEIDKKRDQLKSQGVAA